ncbi:MAG: hypothetical protein ABI549_03450 [Flavobacterium sp.]|uniref:hypothetical protein n=1 Tax=Flavobacterium sp. TaxID=239 RepID=UPI003267A563
MKRFIFIFFITINYNINAQMNSGRTWFKNKNYTLLEIVKYKSISNHKIEASISVNDTIAINEIIERIENIPTNGDMMISFGPNTEHIELTFYKEEDCQKIEIYNHRFKTPSTGFNSDKNETESTLYKDIINLLSSNLNK